MPLLSRENLAERLRHNWLTKPALDPVCQQPALDDSLTSLSWLQNLSIMKLGSPANSHANIPVIDHSEIRVDPNSVLNMAPRMQAPNPVLRPMTSIELTQPTAIDYKTNPFVKPPYSYASLICMAMKESKRNKITLAGIYCWITENFMYYRMADPSWQNSIRHNLSLNKCFQKVPRRKDEPGKGGFWRVNPEYSDMFVDGVFKKRRASSSRENLLPQQPLVKRMRPDDCPVPVVKSEVCEDAAAVMHLNVDELPSALTGADFNWNAVLPQELDLEAVRIKMEPEEANLAAASITNLSPPHSDSNSDAGLEDFFNTDLNDSDLTTGEALDLTVQGHSIQPPDWWGESMTRSVLLSEQPASGLNTPIAPSPAHQHDFTHHPWAENKSELEEAIAHFDLDLQNLFEEESLSQSPLMGGP